MQENKRKIDIIEEYKIGQDAESRGDGHFSYDVQFVVIPLSLF